MYDMQLQEELQVLMGKGRKTYGDFLALARMTLEVQEIQVSVCVCV